MMEKHTKLTSDEHQLLAYFRALSPKDQSDLLRSAGVKAFSRCFPTKTLEDFQPVASEVNSGEISTSSYFVTGECGNDYLTLDEIIRQGCFQDELEPQLFRSEYFDDPDVDPERSRVAVMAFHEQDLYDFYYHAAEFRSYFVTSFIRVWRANIASACRRVVKGMARSLSEAEAQRIPVPSSDEDWIEYALTVDGERLADELDWPLPGDFDHDLTSALESLQDLTEAPNEANKPNLTPTLSLRIALYEKLRFLQARNLLPPSAEQMSEIRAVLERLRGLD